MCDICSVFFLFSPMAFVRRVIKRLTYLLTSRGLNLNLGSVGGRCLKLTDYNRIEERRYLPDRPSQDRGRNYEAEPRPRQ